MKLTIISEENWFSFMYEEEEYSVTADFTDPKHYRFYNETKSEWAKQNKPEDFILSNHEREKFSRFLAKVTKDQETWNKAYEAWESTWIDGPQW